MNFYSESINIILSEFYIPFSQMYVSNPIKVRPSIPYHLFKRIELKFWAQEARKALIRLPDKLQ